MRSVGAREGGENRVFLDLTVIRQTEAVLTHDTTPTRHVATWTSKTRRMAIPDPKTTVAVSANQNPCESCVNYPMAAKICNNARYKQLSTLMFDMDNTLIPTRRADLKTCNKVSVVDIYKIKTPSLLGPGIKVNGLVKCIGNSG